MAPPLTGYSTGENLSCPLPAEALRREGPAPPLGSTIELILFAESLASWS